jgi:hypothetical protein
MDVSGFTVLFYTSYRTSHYERRNVRLLVLAVSCVLLHPLWGLTAAAALGNLDALRRLRARGS